MLPISERPEVTTDLEQFAKDFRKSEEAFAGIASTISSKPQRKSIKFYIIDAVASFFEPIIERALTRIKDKKNAAMEKLKQDLADAYAQAPNPVKEYEQAYKIKKLGKTINDIALWRAETQAEKNKKNPKSKPIKRLEDWRTRAKSEKLSNQREK